MNQGVVADLDIVDQIDGGIVWLCHKINQSSLLQSVARFSDCPTLDPKHGFQLLRLQFQRVKPVPDVTLVQQKEVESGVDIVEWLETVLSPELGDQLYIGHDYFVVESFSAAK